MIIVTGASGQLGRAIVTHLMARVPAQRIGVSVRDPEKAAEFARAGVRVRQGNFDEPATLADAFEGATQVLIVSSNARRSGGDPLAQHKAAMEAAKAAGARRIVYTSHMAASATSAFSPMHDHAATEGMLQESGLKWTALRHGFYASSAVDLLTDALKTGVATGPQDGKVAWTAHADLAEAAAIILASDDMFDGPTPPLTAGKALDLADLVALVEPILGRKIGRAALSDDDWCAMMAARGLPDAVVGMMLGLFVAARAGEFAMVDPTLERLLGRAPLTMRAVLEQRLKP